MYKQQSESGVHFFLSAAEKAAWEKHRKAHVSLFPSLLFAQRRTVIADNSKCKAKFTDHKKRGREGF